MKLDNFPWITTFNEPTYTFWIWNQDSEGLTPRQASRMFILLKNFLLSSVSPAQPHLTSQCIAKISKRQMLALAKINCQAFSLTSWINFLSGHILANWTKLKWQYPLVIWNERTYQLRWHPMKDINAPIKKSATLTKVPHSNLKKECFSENKVIQLAICMASWASDLKCGGLME